MRGACLALIVVGSIALPGGASAQPEAPSPVRLTLQDAVSRGLASSHRLGELAARRDAAEAVGAERHALALPQVSAQAGVSRTNHVEVFGITLPNGSLRVIYPDIPDNYRSRLDLQWPIYTAGRIDALERAARAEASASEHDIATARADLRLEITRAYWALATAIESVRVVDESLQRMNAHLQDVRNRLAAGLVPPNDVASVEAQRSRQQMLTIQARALRDNASADLARLSGLDPATPIEPAAAFDAPPSDVPAPASLLVEARERRSERTALQTRIGAAGERVRAAAAGDKPTIGVGGGVEYSRPNPRIFPRAESWKDSWDASINVSWPLLDGGRTKAEVAEAAALRRSIEERLADFDVTLAAEVRQRASDLTASRAAIAAAADAVRAAGEARRVVGDRFTAGVAINTEVIDAQVALLQAQLDHTQAMATARLAEARLERTLGR